MTESKEEQKSGTISMKISTAIHAELKKISDATGKSLHVVTEEVFFAKLALKKEQDGSIDKEDAKCTVFELAIKYKIDVLKQLTAAAGLKYKLVQIEKLNNPDKIEYRDLFCCPQCSEKFATQYQCMTHFNKEHEQKPESKAVYLCPFCQFERLCSSKALLEAHLLAEHKDKFNPPPTPIERPIPARPEIIEKVIAKEVRVKECICGLNFKNDEEYRNHVAKCGIILEERLKVI